MKTRAKCGTLSGYQRHRNLGEPSCDDCDKAVADYHVARRQKQRQSSACGTLHGYAYHLAKNEIVCDRCDGVMQSMFAFSQVNFPDQTPLAEGFFEENNENGNEVYDA